MTHHAELGLSFSPPRELDFSYLAGLLDGEGHFRVGSRFKSEGRNRGMAALQITMTDRAAIEWCHETFGGRFYKNGSSPRGRVVYGWSLTRQEDLRYVLPRLLPYLKVKGSQAWALLRVVETLRAQPNHGSPPTKAMRPIRRYLRSRWRCDVALAQASLFEARRALSDCNPPSAAS